ncbi:MAG TPA: M28 family peptidase [Streptosporangiaceae bacterium]|jgi:N-acetylated-alpha-linked acidic dipeptidase
MIFRRPILRAGIPLVALATAAALASPASASGSGPIPGFTAAHARWERGYESAFSAIPDTKTAQRLDKGLSAEPGLVASSGDWRRVKMVADDLRSYGLTPQIKTYYTYVSHPGSVSVRETAPDTRNLPTKEIQRPWQKDFNKVVEGYNALSPSGNVTAPIVYANYGSPADFAALKKAGVDVKGKIALIRYGSNFRGVKTHQAYLNGAKGVIIYSDPADDGFTKGTVYPNGPWRAPDGIQRGSVGQIWNYTGDPLTPGWAATKGAPRIKPSDAKELAELPTTPIGYGAAQPLLKAMTGPEAPKAFQGGLPFKYHLGPGPTKVNLDLKINYKVKPIWDVLATIPGKVHPDQEVLVGGHRDTWTYGSDDNLSGTEAVLQIARGLGKLLKTGWRPNRTIRLATWDGEEIGLYGSTEYAEQRGTDLNKVVAYLNMDGAAGRHFGASAVPVFDNLIYNTTKDVAWPGTSGSVYDDWKNDSGGKTPSIGRLGSGSDYTAFFQRYGVPALNLGSGTDSGDYHCACDEYYTESKFIDPGWIYHVATAKLVGITTLRIANADALPLSYSGYASEVAGYLNTYTSDQKSQLGTVQVDVSRDVTQAGAWQRAADSLTTQANAALKRGDTATLNRLNTRLQKAERTLLTSAGLPGRPWYRHQIYAPGLDTGYATRTLPALYDATFTDKNPAEARAYEAHLYDSLKAATNVLAG